MGLCVTGIRGAFDSARKLPTYKETRRGWNESERSGGVLEVFSESLSTLEEIPLIFGLLALLFVNVATTRIGRPKARLYIQRNGERIFALKSEIIFHPCPLTISVRIMSWILKLIGKVSGILNGPEDQA
jgi:hypothetical protein